MKVLSVIRLFRKGAASLVIARGRNRVGYNLFVEC